MSKPSSIRFKQRIRIDKSYIWSISLYGTETWTLRVDLTNNLRAFELRCYRRIPVIPWTERISNVVILRRMGSEIQLILTITVRRISYLSHIPRHEKYDLPQHIIKGNIEGKRGIGKKKL